MAVTPTSHVLPALDRHEASTSCSSGALHSLPSPQPLVLGYTPTRKERTHTVDRPRRACLQPCPGHMLAPALLTSGSHQHHPHAPQRPCLLSASLVLSPQGPLRLGSAAAGYVELTMNHRSQPTPAVTRNSHPGTDTMFSLSVYTACLMTHRNCHSANSHIIRTHT